MMAPIRATANPVPGFLVVGQRIVLSVLRCVGHRDRRPVEEMDSAAFPEPLGIHAGIERLPHPSGHGGEEFKR